MDHLGYGIRPSARRCGLATWPLGRWHRAAGRLLIPCGLAAALSGQPVGLPAGALVLAGWLINLVVIEWVLRRQSAKPARP